MYDITIIVHLTLTTIEIKIIILLSHIIDEHLFLVEKIVTGHRLSICVVSYK